MNTIQDNDVIVHIVRSMSKKILNCYDWSNQVQSIIKTKKTTMWPIIQVRSTPNTIINFRQQSKWVLTTTKTIWGNDLINHIDVVYTENKIEIAWLNEPGTVWYENYIGQRRDWLYKSYLHWNQNWTIKTFVIGCGMWWKWNKTMMWPIV